MKYPNGVIKPIAAFMVSLLFLFNLLPLAEALSLRVQPRVSSTTTSSHDDWVSYIYPQGLTIKYSTYLGGSAADSSYDITVDAEGCAYVTGWTQSTDFPVKNPLQPHYAEGSYDAFVTKITPIGDNLIYSTYLGGNSSDVGRGIAVDTSGAAYVTGFTWSTDFPVENPFQDRLVGFADAFVAKISPDGSELNYSTYLGGNEIDNSCDIAVDNEGFAYVTGWTRSENFPVANPFRDNKAGEQDAFVTKLTPAGNTLAYSTYLGGGSGTGLDGGNGIAVDDWGCAYVVGDTGSDDFPIYNPYQSAIAGEKDAFVTKLNSTGGVLLYSTYLGGSKSDTANNLAINDRGEAYVVGETLSTTDFPTVNALQPAFGGLADSFITKFTPAGNTLIYSTYLGGSGYDKGIGIATDTFGAAYVTGYTYSNDFPLMYPFQAIYAGNGDSFVAKITPDGSALVYSTYLGGSASECETYYGGIAVDRYNNAYVTGTTTSSDFPVMKPFQPKNAGGSDVFVTKIKEWKGDYESR